MEAEFIGWLRERLSADARVPLGLGSDAAVIRGRSGGRFVVTTDALTDGVDFLLDADDPRRIGRKALAVNLSDLAAMASRPVAALVTLVLPRPPAALLARELFEGILSLAAEFDVAIAGGDTNTWDGSLVISITALGEPPANHPWSRGGARPGDAILVTGQFGGSRLGKQFDFTPRVREALRLNERYDIHAATDVSDGLSLDLSHILTESGCGGELDLATIPIAPAAATFASQCADGSTPLDHALSDGEDFELIVTTSADVARRLLSEQPLGVPLTQIGRCISSRGLWGIEGSGVRHSLTPRGYQH